METENMETENMELNDSRDVVLHDYESAKIKNRELFRKGNVKASSDYIYENQKYDASVIMDKFYHSSIRAVSIVKRTKVGMDGLMIEIAKNICTHPDNTFALHRENVFFITAMSNLSWEDDMKEKIPTCFRENVYHHGKLQRLITKLKNIKNAIIINDEIDSGDKEDQKLHNILKNSGVLDIKYMEENNLRFVFVSATMINELRELNKWGDKHYIHYMTIPESYIGHKEFLEREIIQEYYPVDDDESAEKWVREDILENYGTDFRIHIIRTDKKNIEFIHRACNRNHIDFRNHTSTDRISYEDLSNIFESVTKHLVIAVKGFYRRANLIPNTWKEKIGATHERFVKEYDTNVQVQGLPGRMTGYWKDKIMQGFKTGPHRTSIDAIKEYEEFYKNPLEKKRYNTSGSSKNTFVNPKHIKNLHIVSAAASASDSKVDIKTYRCYPSKETVVKVCKILGYSYKISAVDENGFIKTGGTKKSHVTHLNEAIKLVPIAIGKDKGKITYRTCYPCYTDITDNTTLRFIVIIRPTTDISKIEEVDRLYPSIQIS